MASNFFTGILETGSDNNTISSRDLSVPISIRSKQSNISNSTDPAVEWIHRVTTDSISITKDHHTFDDSKLGHVSPATYFGNNFSPLTSFTDDSDAGSQHSNQNSQNNNNHHSNHSDIQNNHSCIDRIEMIQLPPISTALRHSSSTYRPSLSRSYSLNDTSSSPPPPPSSSSSSTSEQNESNNVSYPRLLSPHLPLAAIPQSFTFIESRSVNSFPSRPVTRQRHNPPRSRSSNNNQFRLPSLFYDENASVNSDSVGSYDETLTPISRQSSASSTSGGTSSYKSKPRGRKSLNETATKILTDWIIEHQDDPYPSQAEKESLARRGGVSVKQVVDWMTNMRKRRLHPLLSGKRTPKSSLDYMFLRNHRMKKQKEYEDIRMNRNEGSYGHSYHHPHHEHSYNHPYHHNHSL